MPPFFLNWGKNLKYRKIPQLGRSRKQADRSKTAEKQGNAPSRKNYMKSELEQNSRKTGECSKPEELHEE